MQINTQLYNSVTGHMTYCPVTAQHTVLWKGVRGQADKALNDMTLT
jgi:hypothetical protein